MEENKNYLHIPFGVMQLPAFQYVVALLLLVLLLFGCVGCEKERNPWTLPGAHPDSWLQKSSDDFHGYVVLKNGAGACVKCHGHDLNGGKVKVSCVECHTQQTDLCIDCHGGFSPNDKSGAPPFGLRDEYEDTALAVGAHTVHLSGSNIAAAIACATCHVVPGFVLDSSHFDHSMTDPNRAVDSVAEIHWSGLGVLNGVPVWNREDRTCASVYCHGNFSGGDTSNNPIWTAPNQADCGSCHDTGAQPDRLLWKHAFHISVAGLECSDCHAQVVNKANTIIAPNLHVNGKIDTLVLDSAKCNSCHESGTQSCTICHGGTDNQTGAPPKGLRGEVLSSHRAVGAHSKHLAGGDMASGLLCTTCHSVPGGVMEPGHMGIDSIAEIAWGGISNMTGNAAWNRTSNMCASTYCHGNFSGGKTANSPTWTSTNQALCGSCHDVGSQPSLLLWKHDVHMTLAQLQCVDCHSDVVDSSLSIVNKDLHVNGAVNSRSPDPTKCVKCHGSGAELCVQCHGGTNSLLGDPPLGIRGETATTSLAVGAHDKHMRGGSLSDGGACADCHIVPALIIAPSHLGVDSIAELTWGNYANRNGGATWNRTAQTCAATYCHGNFSGGKSANTPSWTGANQAACGSCHDTGTNPSQLSGRHSKHAGEGIACYRCHSTTVNSANAIVGLSQHVDNVNTVSFWNGSGSYNPSTKRCTSPGGCHGNENW